MLGDADFGGWGLACGFGASTDASDSGTYRLRGVGVGIETVDDINPALP